MRDRQRAAAKRGSTPFVFSPEDAQDACEFIEKLPHVEGRWETTNVVLHPAHVFFLVNLFGFRNHDGTRRFTSALFAVARKNAKSWLAAAVLLYCLCCEDEPGAQLITAATTGSQARIVFNMAKKIVSKTHALADHFDLETFANSIVAHAAGAAVKPINAKASTQDGLNPSHTVLDEIHAHKTHDLLNVLRSAAGARINPLWLYTTTEGYETPGPWPELRQFAYQLLDGIIEADHFLVIIYALDEQEGQPGQPGYLPADDDFDSSKWVKANPLIEVNPILLREIEKAALEARQMPGTHAEFKIKRLNRQSSVVHGWVNLVKWRACTRPVQLDKLTSIACWGGLDLSLTSDLTSFRLVWRLDDLLLTYGWCWVPRAAVHRRKERGLVPYPAWVQSGALIECGEDTIDYDVVSAKVLEANRTFNIQKIAYDDWNAKQILDKLAPLQSKMVPFVQGTKSYHPAMKLLEEKYLAGKVAHGSAPVLTWCASNIVARKDVNENLAPDKRKSKEKIDDFVAMLMATGISISDRPKQPRMFFV